MQFFLSVASMRIGRVSNVNNKIVKFGETCLAVGFIPRVYVTYAIGAFCYVGVRIRHGLTFRSWLCRFRKISPPGNFLGSFVLESPGRKRGARWWTGGRSVLPTDVGRRDCALVGAGKRSRFCCIIEWLTLRLINKIYSWEERRPGMCRRLEEASL